MMSARAGKSDCCIVPLEPGNSGGGKAATPTRRSNRALAGHSAGRTRALRVAQAPTPFPPSRRLSGAVHFLDFLGILAGDVRLIDGWSFRRFLRIMRGTDVADADRFCARPGVAAGGCRRQSPGLVSRISMATARCLPIRRRSIAIRWPIPARLLAGDFGDDVGAFGDNGDGGVGAVLLQGFGDSGFDRGTGFYEQAVQRFRGQAVADDFDLGSP
jgi:hypothetical protein